MVKGLLWNDESGDVRPCIITTPLKMSPPKQRLLHILTFHELMIQLKGCESIHMYEQRAWVSKNGWCPHCRLTGWSPLLWSNILLCGPPVSQGTLLSITVHLNPIQHVSNAKNLKHEATSERKRDLLGQPARKQSAWMFWSSNLCMFI